MKRLLRTIALASALFLPLTASAITLLPSCATTSDPAKAGNCQISDILAVFMNFAEYLLGISGAVALAFFVYGGFRYVLSRGDKGEVAKATAVLRSAVIGVAIIFLSGVLVRFTTQALTGGVSKIPTLGESCATNTIKPNFGVSAANGNGLWVSIPAGLDANANKIAEGLVCVKKETAAAKVGDPCTNLNAILLARSRKDDAKFTCKEIEGSSSCVRGLCSRLSSTVACCK